MLGLLGLERLNLAVKERFVAEGSPYYDAFFRERLRFLEEEYGLVFYTHPGLIHQFLTIKGPPALAREIVGTIGVIRQEVLKYPRSYFRENGSTQVTLLENVSDYGQGYSGLFARYDPTSFIATKDYSTVGPERIASIFHHEKYHSADWNDQGYKENEAWEAIHNCECSPFARSSSQPHESFSSSYGKLNPMEDRAVMAQNMMVASAHRNMLETLSLLADTNAQRIMFEKYRFMKDQYWRFSKGKMDERYWQDLLQERVDERYFA